MVDYVVIDNIAILTINNPPVNSLSDHVKVALVEHFNRSINDSNVHCIILTGGKNFCVGADVNQFANVSSPAFGGNVTLAELQHKLEASEKPCVAAIMGFALGGGFGLGLACHYRIVHENAIFGFPEVLLGLSSSGRIFMNHVNLKTALELITTGKNINVYEAQKMGIIDKITGNDVVQEAMLFAKQIIHEPLAPRRSRNKPAIDAKEAQYLRDVMLAKVVPKMRGLIAPIISIKVATAYAELPYEQALELDKFYMTQLHSSGQAKAMQYAWLAERQASQWQLSDGRYGSSIKPKPVKCTAVIGGGTMGSGIVVVALTAGFSVVLVEVNEELLKKSMETIRQLLEGAVFLNKLTELDAKQAFTRLKGSLNYEDLNNADLVIEAVFENMNLKKQIFARLDNVCKAETILCTNTSSLSIDELAKSTKRPDRVIGTHFFVPSYYMKPLEVIKGIGTSPETIATVMWFGQKIGKLPLLVGNCPMFVANRIFMPLINETEFLVEEGASPYEIDQVLEDFGIPMGPFKVVDMEGLDIGYKVASEHFAARGLKVDSKSRFVGGERYCSLIKKLVEQGRLGRKSSRGWYKYEKPGARVPYPDNDIFDIIEQYRRNRNIVSRKVSLLEIQKRCLIAAINEAFKVLEEGIADIPTIDTMMIMAYGWPRQTGGPLFYAQQIGLNKVVEDIIDLHRQYPTSSHWLPSSLLNVLAVKNTPFENWAAEVKKYNYAHSQL